MKPVVEGLARELAKVEGMDLELDIASWGFQPEWLRKAKEILSYLYRQGYRKVEPAELPVLEATKEHSWSSACIRAAEAQRADILKRLEVEGD